MALQHLLPLILPGYAADALQLACVLCLHSWAMLAQGNTAAPAVWGCSNLFLCQQSLDCISPPLPVASAAEHGTKSGSRKGPSQFICLLEIWILVGRTLSYLVFILLQ